MTLKNLTLPIIPIALSLAMMPFALNAMEDATNSTRTGVLRSRGSLCSATIVDRLGVELPREEHGDKRGPYHLTYDWTDYDSDDPTKIPTVHYTVTKEGKELLKEHKEIPPNTITFIQLDHEKRYLALWCCLTTSQFKISEALECLKRPDQMSFLLSQPFSRFKRTVIKLLNPEK